ncbi:MAG TPA: sigma-54 dependent transcriptional regulator [Aliidongia sp.]|nr:sigma-54 dependent transcriptional regulator [Aliidongia sp.]
MLVSDLKPRILIVDDDPDVLTAARLLLRRTAETVETERRAEAALARLEAGTWDAILLDMNLTDGKRDGADGYNWLERFRSVDPSVSVVLMTAFGGVPVAVEAMKRGATDFVLKPWQNERLVATVLAATNLSRSRREVGRLETENRALADIAGPSDETIIGNAPSMRRVFELVARAAPTRANVLILGESGTGKEVIAREIHRRSDRASKPFVSVDLGAVSETLFESELFGHKKGAFTDAKADRPGRMVASSGGTLFLDEIGNLPLYLQRKLLTVLERQEVVPVGGDRPVSIDLRLVTATNMPAAELAREQVFRQDLLYRINTVELTLPPLRERPGDIAALAQHFIAIYARKYNVPRRRLGAEGLAALEAYPWPGNVRELRHAIERATILGTGDHFLPDDFPAAHGARDGGPAEAETYNLDEIERRVIRRALADHDGNISRAASALGLTRAALYRRIERHGL